LHPLLETEYGTVRKKWKGRLATALLYPNTYSLAVSNLGFQILYRLLNGYEELVCERLVYPQDQESFRSLESSRPLRDFPIIFASVSFEQDYPRLAAMLAAGQVPPYAAQRSGPAQPGQPCVFCGGVGVFMNPEPLAPFADLMVLGEAEVLLPRLLPYLLDLPHRDRRTVLYAMAQNLPGCYLPAGYQFDYAEDGRVLEIKAAAGLPERVRRVAQMTSTTAGHSELLSPEAELSMYMTELGRGCTRGCRFCAAGFIYRPPRLWSSEAVLAGLAQRPSTVQRIGLLGMEMADSSTLDHLADLLRTSGCSLSFSSLRADRISPQVLDLLSQSGLKSVALAPDGCSERLRQVINKGLSQETLVQAATALVAAGISTLKLYVMIGLPTEGPEDLEELVELIQAIRKNTLPLGKKQGRLCQLFLSVNCFVPKPWTPFQYLSFGALEGEEALGDRSGKAACTALNTKIHILKKALASIDNLHLRVERPENVLSQAVFARADRRIAPVLLDMGRGRASFKQAMKAQGLSPWEYAIRPRSFDEQFCWYVVDQGIRPDHLAKECAKALRAEASPPCQPSSCRRCGVCSGTESP
jgi:radical SAM superfamily enzyme YgiQ (UPF0313 family)